MADHEAPAQTTLPDTDEQPDVDPGPMAEAPDVAEVPAATVNLLESLSAEQMELIARAHRENNPKPSVKARLGDARTPIHRYLVHPNDIPIMEAHPQGATVLAAIGYGDNHQLRGGRGTEPTIATTDATQGTTGLEATGGRIYQEYNERILSLQDRMSVFEEMRRSEQAFAACEALITTPLANTDYWLEPGDRNDPASVRFAEMLNWNLSDGLTRSFSETMREASLALFYGFTWCYPRYERKLFQGQEYVGWRQFAPRARATVDRWRFDDDGGLRGLVQCGQLPTTGEVRYINYDIEQILLWTWRGDNGDPEGLGAFRQAYKAYSYKTAFEEFAAIRIERTACGIPIAEGPVMQYDDDDAALVLAILNNIRAGNDNAIVVPNGWKIYMLDLGAADIPFADHIERQRQGMLEPFLAQFLMLSQGGSAGSNALSKDASSTFFDNSNYAADWLCDTFNRYEIPRICARNKPELVGSRQPRLMHGKVGVRDLERFTRALELPFRDRTEMPVEIVERWADMMGLSPTEVTEGLQRMKAERAEREEQEREAQAAGGGGGDE